MDAMKVIHVDPALYKLTLAKVVQQTVDAQLTNRTVVSDEAGAVVTLADAWKRLKKGDVVQADLDGASLRILQLPAPAKEEPPKVEPAKEEPKAAKVAERFTFTPKVEEPKSKVGPLRRGGK